MAKRRGLWEVRMDVEQTGGVGLLEVPDDLGPVVNPSAGSKRYENSRVKVAPSLRKPCNPVASMKSLTI